jgi:hypothetical protein
LTRFCLKLVGALSLACATTAGCVADDSEKGDRAKAGQSCERVFGTYFIDSSEQAEPDVYPLDDSYSIDFSTEDGKYIYRSWLHERPFETGTYAQQGCSLAIETAAGSTTYKIVRLQGNQLWLEDSNDGAVEKFYNRNE